MLCSVTKSVFAMSAQSARLFKAIQRTESQSRIVPELAQTQAHASACHLIFVLSFP
jgi:hypothetical protein